MTNLIQVILLSVTLILFIINEVLHRRLVNKAKEAIMFADNIIDRQMDILEKCASLLEKQQSKIIKLEKKIKLMKREMFEKSKSLKVKSK